MLHTVSIHVRTVRDRLAVVTGATGGLGQAIARRLAADGARLVLTGRQPEVLERLGKELGATTVVCDLARRDDLAALLGVVADADILVSNAALPGTGPLDDFTVEEIDRALDVNLRP